MIDPNQLGSFLLYLAMVLTAFSATASVVGRYRADGRLMIAGERAGYALCAVLVCASFILVHSFLDHDYANKYVQRYSDNSLGIVGGNVLGWSGGSLMFDGRVSSLQRS